MDDAMETDGERTQQPRGKLSGTEPRSLSSQQEDARKQNRSIPAKAPVTWAKLVKIRAAEAPAEQQQEKSPSPELSADDDGFLEEMRVLRRSVDSPGREHRSGRRGDGRSYVGYRQGDDDIKWEFGRSHRGGRSSQMDIDAEDGKQHAGLSRNRECWNQRQNQEAGDQRKNQFYCPGGYRNWEGGGRGSGRPRRRGNWIHGGIVRASQVFLLMCYSCACEDLSFVISIMVHLPHDVCE